jgi:phage terminase small subunit
MDDEPLTRRQAEFVRYYLIAPNGAEAARKAGYSKKGADTQASTLLRNRKVQAALAVGRAALVADGIVTRDWLVEQVRTALTVAQRDGQGQVVARNAELLARMHGWIDDKPAAPQQLVNLIIQR